jgi:RNA polymerase sigma-70 factor (ECF subfamily)
LLRYTPRLGAWNRLLSEVRRLAMDLARWRYRLGREDAEDVAQAVQIRVTDRLPQLRSSECFPSWLRRLVRHAVIDHLRQRRPTLSLEELTDPDAAAGPETGDVFDQITLRADLDRALSRLPAHYRQPIRMHVLEGLPQDEVGRLLGRPRSTVASQIERGLRRMERTLSAGYAANR